MNIKDDQSIKELINNNQKSYSCTLTISLLVSNNFKTIKNCLESLKPLLDQVSSELIIIDTVGSKNSDGSLTIAQKYATKIIHYNWNNDFAAARNAGLAVAQGEWFLYIDDDEWFDDVDELISFFNNKKERDQYCSLAFTKHNYLSFSGTNYEAIPAFQCSRIFKNTKFIYPIHENLSPILYPMKKVNSFVHHYGYADQKLAEKVTRNETLLKKFLKTHPEDIHAWSQLILSSENNSKDEQKIVQSYIEQANLNYEKNPLNQTKNFRYFVMIFYYSLTLKLKQENWSQIIDTSKKFIADHHVSDLQKAILNNYCFNAAIGLNDYSKAGKFANSFQKHLRSSKNYQTEDFTNPFEKKASEIEFFKMQVILVSYYQKQHDWEKINFFSSKTRLKKAPVFMSKLIPAFVTAAFHNDHPKKLLKIIFQNSYSNNEFPKAFGQAITKVKIDLSSKEKKLLIKCLAEFHSDDPFIKLHQLIAIQNKASFQDLFSRLKDQITLKVPNESLLTLLIKKQIDPSYLALKLNFEEWNEAISAWISTCLSNSTAIPKIVDKILESWTHTCWQREFLLHRLTHCYLFNNFTAGTEIKAYLPEYLKYTKSLCQTQYSINLFEITEKKQLNILPGEFRFCFYLQKAVKAEQIKDYLELLRLALKEYPTGNQVIKKLQRLVKIQLGQDDQVQKQLKQMGMQVKIRVATLISQGYLQESLELLTQLQKLTPNDSEVPKLIKLVVRELN
ncbi:glycosyltransferase [Liquorilactobacillus nagelii]|uniref:glycosyltransferase n=1 Tax=Liquorilactobacillus nagelii TaxID=82688 RepID=UPI0039EBAD50